MVRKFKITVEGRTYEVFVEEMKERKGFAYTREPGMVQVPDFSKSYGPQAILETTPQAVPVKEEVKTTAGEEVIRAPIPGKILRIIAKKGQFVKKGGLLLTLEAMKMENEIFAPRDLTVTDIFIETQKQVKTGDPLIKIS